jgi:hypothetical protein
MPDDSADEVFERLQDIVQQAILREFPNPERKGCPGTAVLRQLANRPRPTRDAAWDHVTHCSPCYREFLDLREQVKRRLELERRQVIRRRAVLGGIAVVLVGGGIAAYELFERREPGSQELGPYLPTLLDLRDTSRTRSAGGQTAAAKPHVLPAKRLDLTILLPIGSEPGRYDIQWLKDVDKPLLSTSGNASVENGVTVLRVKLDLSRQTPGNYLIGLRQPPSDWTFYQVTLT